MYQVYKIDSTITPELYYLCDLMKDKVDGTFYKEQLTISTKPDYKNNFFEVEKILHEKKFAGKKYYLVKFLYYSSKFNQYIPEENMIFSKDLQNE